MNSKCSNEESKSQNIMVIVVDKDKCKGCGLCVKICHEHCMALINDTVRINYEFCNTCTQCIAVCQQQALSWDHVPPVAYDQAVLPSQEQLGELFKERRSIRFYKIDRIDRTLLEEIIGYGIYAPTNNFELRVIVVDDEEVVEELDRIVLRFTSRIYNLIYKPRIVYNLVRRIASGRELEKAKPKMESAQERGHTFLSPPAAIVFIVGDKRIALSEASAQYALYNMILYAQAKGIGSCPWGNGPIFIDRNKAARERLGLQKHEHILGALVLGYPAVKFANKVEGKTLSIRWNEG
jgi:nitroreductase/NAD-dependent dihydropyrimidine dehydrogenase PreA subunit